MGRWNSEKAEADTHRWENLGAIWMEKKAADEARDREIRELKQLIECLHERTKSNTEMVGQLIEATKDNARNARKAQEADVGTQEVVNAIRGRISSIEQILTEPERRRAAKPSEYAADGTNGPPREREERKWGNESTTGSWRN